MNKLPGRKVIYTNRFEKEYALCSKRGLDVGEIDAVINLLAERKTLPSSYRDHPLKGQYKGHRECHVQGDWLFVYRITDDDLVLVATRTGTHSDLFDR